MSKEEVVNIRNQLSFESHTNRHFYLLGQPIHYSPSPTFHNKVFSSLNLPDIYKNFSTDNLD